MLDAADEHFNELLAIGFLTLDAEGVGLAGVARVSRCATSRRSATCSATGRRRSPPTARPETRCAAGSVTRLAPWHYTLILLRHGESDWNPKNLFTGWVDVDLTEKGRAEAVAVAGS